MRVELDSSLQTNIEVEMCPGQVCGPALDTKRKMKSIVCRDEVQLRRDNSYQLLALATAMLDTAASGRGSNFSLDMAQVRTVK